MSNAIKYTTIGREEFNKVFNAKVEETAQFIMDSEDLNKDFCNDVLNTYGDTVDKIFNTVNNMENIVSRMDRNTRLVVSTVLAVTLYTVVEQEMNDAGFKIID